MARRARRQVDAASAFWDSSALVPLCVSQSFTPRAIELYKSYGVVIWWAAPVEIASALRRLLRMKQLDAGEYARSLQLAARLADSWMVVQPSESVRRKAVQLVENHDVRAADALQLSAALEWCQQSPQARLFLAADQRLREAALISGFDCPQL